MLLIWLYIKKKEVATLEKHQTNSKKKIQKLICHMK
jgi:hypothetical protein